MFAKHVSQLIFSDIDDLVNIRKEREGYQLDFKEEFGNPDKVKKELAKDISAFANTGGGYLIIGVDNQYNIVGITKEIQNKPVDEWINQVISSNVEPHVFYFDPKIITIPDSEKVVVVIHIPESSKKPHIVTEWNKYHIRINDSSKSANHNQIRDMFEFSKNRTDEFNNFLQKRNIADEDTTDFGLNKNSKKLFSEVPEKTGRLKPFVLFSLIPKYLKEEKINLPINEFKIWLDKNSNGYNPYPSMSLFNALNNYDLKLDGIILKQGSNDKLTSYFEVLNNGYVEAGFSSSITSLYKNKDNEIALAISLTQIVGYEMLFLGFARNLYELAKYYDDVFLQISFVNVLKIKLFGFSDKYRNLAFYNQRDIANHQNSNFKLIYKFNPKTLKDNEILKIAKIHSEKICRVFGLDRDLCFVNDNININELNYFKL